MEFSMPSAWSLSSGAGEPSWEESPGTRTQRSNLASLGVVSGSPAIVPGAEPSDIAINLQWEAVNLPGKLGEGVGHGVCINSWGFCNKLLQILWFKAIKIYPLTVLESRSLKSKCQQGHTPSEGSGRESFVPLPASLAPGMPWLVAV